MDGRARKDAGPGRVLLGWNTIQRSPYACLSTSVRAPLTLDSLNEANRLILPNCCNAVCRHSFVEITKFIGKVYIVGKI